MKEMWSPQTILPIDNPPPPLAGLKRNFADEGLGWNLQDYHGRKLVGHRDGIGAFVSRVVLVPEENLGFVCSPMRKKKARTTPFFTACLITISAYRLPTGSPHSRVSKTRR